MYGRLFLFIIDPPELINLRVYSLFSLKIMTLVHWSKLWDKFKRFLLLFNLLATMAMKSP